MVVRELSLQLDVNGQLALAIAVQVHDVPLYILLSHNKQAIGWERCQESFPTLPGRCRTLLQAYMQKDSMEEVTANSPLPP